MKEYPHVPIVEKGCSVILLNDQIDDKGIHGKPQSMFPLSQSKILNTKIIKIAEKKRLKSLQIFFIKKKPTP